ncbi:TetR/AcrR family transcriptional regulator [Martelella soudanensis]|uniref:TetR/AcrR family transcriptional regulator n=1 Tax=unclassified Martelella TaxID=2629616 RepID=UPI0015E00BD2|nr:MULTISPECIES: TetR/AcrR family transcriptional regulator [unclassified Martelella]
MSRQAQQINSKDDAGQESAVPSKQRILDAASLAFAKDGIDGVSLRQITTAAGTNSASVNYHFKSKADLVHEVLDDLARRVNERRIAALEALFKERDSGGAPDIGDLIDIFLSPYLEPDRPHEGVLLTKLLHAHRAAPSSITTEIVKKRFDPLATRFVDALKTLYPELDRSVLVWRYFFMVGGVLLGVSEVVTSSRLNSVSEGAIEVARMEDLRVQLVSFLTGGFAEK